MEKLFIPLYSIQVCKKYLSQWNAPTNISYLIVLYIIITITQRDGNHLSLSIFFTLFFREELIIACMISNIIDFTDHFLSWYPSCRYIAHNRHESSTT